MADKPVPDLMAQLEALGQSHRFDWSGVDGAPLLEAVRKCVRRGWAVRISAVGYGTAVRLQVSLEDGAVWGATCTDAVDLNQVATLLSMDGVEEQIARVSEQPRRAYKRR